MRFAAVELLREPHFQNEWRAMHFRGLTVQDGSGKGAGSAVQDDIRMLRGPRTPAWWASPPCAGKCKRCPGAEKQGETCRKTRMSLNRISRLHVSGLDQ